MKSLVLLFFMFCFSITFSQTLEKQISYIEYEANVVYKAKSYRDALPYYEYLDSVAPNNSQYNYRVGVCKYELGGLQGALESFEKAKLYGEDEPKLHFYLGSLYHKTNRFDEAEREYVIYRDGLDDPEEQRVINHYISQCEAAIELLKDQLELKIQNIGPVVNSSFADYVPLTDAEEKVMIFTSRRKGGVSEKIAPDGEYYEDIYMSRKMSDGKWSKPKNLEAINDKYHNASVSISADATKIYFYESGKKKTDVGIYESTYELNEQGSLEWTKPKKLGDNINMPDTHTPSVSISSDGKKLYLSSDRAGGFGGLDLYVSELDEKGEWGLPSNLGETVNTEYDEDSPFIHNSDQVLFYSSKGHLGMGGYDVFFSRRQKDDTWGSAVNFGAPVNSTNDDVFFNWTADESKGYYSTQRTDGFGEKDIYVIRRPFDDPNITVLKGYVEDVISGKPVKAMIVVMDANTKEIIAQTDTDSNGRYKLHVREEEEYIVKVEADGYLLDEKDIYVPKEYGYYEMKENIDVVPYGKESLDVDSLVVYKKTNSADVEVSSFVKQAASKKLFEHEFVLGDLSRFRDSMLAVMSVECCVIMANGDLFSIVGEESQLEDFGFPMSVYSLKQLNSLTDSLLKVYDNNLTQPLYAHGNPLDIIDVLDENQLDRALEEGVLVKVGDEYRVVDPNEGKIRGLVLGDLSAFRDSMATVLSLECCIVLSNGDLFSLVGEEEKLSENGFPMSVYSMEQLNQVTDSLLKVYNNDLSQRLYAHGDVLDVIDVMSENELEKAIANGSLVKINGDYEIIETKKDKLLDKKVMMAVSDLEMSPEMQNVLKANDILEVNGEEATLNVTAYNLYTDSLNQISNNENVLVITDEGQIETKIKEEEEYVAYKDGEVQDLKEVIEDINAYNEKLTLPNGSKIVMRDVLFAFDSHKLTPESKEVLDGMVKIFVDHPYIKTEISGHTDNVGKDKYNLKLSKKRAKSVAKYLIKDKKVSKDRIVAVGKGETTPYASNGTAKGQKLNRRTELKVVGEIEYDGYRKEELVNLSNILETNELIYSDDESPLSVKVKNDYIEGELLPWKVHFPFNQWASITPYSAGKVKNVIDYLNKHPNAHLMIHSHADPIGDFHENKALAERRGQTVFAYLIENGVDASRLTVNSYGSEAPLVQTENVEKNVINRRVEFEIIH